MDSEVRPTGIEVLDGMRWGTHFSLFYENREDLKEALVPYFKTGLDHGEFCLWVTPELLPVEEAREAIRAAGPAGEPEAWKRQMEIIPAGEWYLFDGRFDPNRVLEKCKEKLGEALAKGYEGMRCCGDPLSVEKQHWERFLEYEAEFDKAIAPLPILAVCSCHMGVSRVSDLLDLIEQHQFTIVRRRGAWEYLGGSEVKRARDDLRSLNAELEERVNERTAQLAEANEALKREMARRRLVQEEIRRSEVRFRALIENAPDVVSLVGADGKVVYASPAGSRILGYSVEEIGQLNPLELVHPDDRPALVALLRELSRHQGRTAMAEYRFRHKDGSWRWLESNISNLMDEPSVQAIVFNFSDITDRKLAEEEIREQLAHLTALSEINRAITSSYDLRLSLGVILDHLREQLGVSAADVLLIRPGSNILEVVSARGFRTRPFEHARLQWGQGLPGRVAQRQQAVHITDLGDRYGDPRLAQHLVDEQFVSYYGAPLVAKGKTKGVLELFHRGPLEPDQQWMSFFEVLAEQAAIAIDNITIFESLQRSTFELSYSYDAAIGGWARSLDLRNHEAEGHTQRVADRTVRLSHALGITEAELGQVRWGAMLHDVGKMGVPERILLKPGPLSNEEWQVMKQHPTLAYQMLAPIRHLGIAVDIPYCHHEKWDGQGYPRGLEGEEIPLSARVFAVVDIWEALTSDRPYRPAWPAEQAYRHITSLSGTDFDPQVVKAFMQASQEE